MTPADPPAYADDVARGATTSDAATSDEATRWALRARGGDATAAAALIRATQAEVWRFAAALVDPGAADDLTQETYLRAFRSLPAFEGRSSVRTWLFGIARRVCADHIRAVVRRRRADSRAGAPLIPAARAAAGDPAATVGAADLLSRLAPGRREAFVLTQLLGLSYAEAAQSAGVPVGTIRSRVARARADLVEMLGAAAVAR